MAVTRASGALSAADLGRIDAQLAATDRLLERNYPGDDGTRQPVHTVYVPADRFTPGFAAGWGAQALAAADAHGGLERLGSPARPGPRAGRRRRVPRGREARQRADRGPPAGLRGRLRGPG